MRKIKFRAWDSEKKEMFTIARYDFADNTVYKHLFACGGFLGENLDIMQYTGLKDERNVEIYDGDIIKGVNCFKESWTGEVKYLAPYFAVLGSDSHMILEDLYDEIVIGNIYENPELIKRGAIKNE